MEKNNPQRNPAPAGAAKHGRGRGFGRGNANNNANNQHNQPPRRNNTNIVPNPVQHRDGSIQERKEKNQHERPWTFGELRAWLTKTIATDPDRSLSNLTGRDEKKFKNALNEKIVLESRELMVLMIQLLSSPDLMDHIRSTKSVSFYSIIMASEFLHSLHKHMLIQMRLDNKCLKSVVKLVNHLADLSPNSILDLVPLIQHLATLVTTIDDASLVTAITNLVAKKDHILDQLRQQAAQSTYDGGPRGA